MNLIVEGWRKYLNEAEEGAGPTGGLSQEIQKLIDQNQFLKGKLVAKEEDLIQSKQYVLVLSEESTKHIKERHMDGSKPGSLFSPNVDLKGVAKKLLDIQPSEAAGGRVKWLGANVGTNIGAMGVAKASPEQLQNMTDYQMPDGKKEQVKISAGKRKPTSEISLITAELGALSDGRKALSLITMFPGGMSVDGVEIPADRSQFAQKGLYFPVDANSPLLQAQSANVEQQPVKENKMKITKQYLKQVIKEELGKTLNEEDKVATALGLSHGYSPEQFIQAATQLISTKDPQEFEKLKSISGELETRIVNLTQKLNKDPNSREQLKQLRMDLLHATSSRGAQRLQYIQSRRKEFSDKAKGL